MKRGRQKGFKPPPRQPVIYKLILQINDKIRLVACDTREITLQQLVAVDNEQVWIGIEHYSFSLKGLECAFDNIAIKQITKVSSNNARILAEQIIKTRQAMIQIIMECQPTKVLVELLQEYFKEKNK